MKRLAFNGGEISPEMALRCDMDAYARSCSSLLNFDVAQTGGITRRKGMRYVCDAMESESVLIPYHYDGDTNYLIELASEKLIVRDGSGNIEAEFEGGDDWSYSGLSKVRWLQLNSILLLASAETPVMQLAMDRGGNWTFEAYEFKNPPWYTVDARERAITVSAKGDGDYTVEFDEEEDDYETDLDTGDILRVSYYTQQQEAFEKSSTLRDGVTIIEAVTDTTDFAAGDKIAMHGDTSCEYWVCTDDWTGSNDFTEGMTSPANYTENFIEAEDLTGFDDITPIYTLSSGSTYKRGDKIAFQSGYWELYTCIRDFTASEDYVSACNLPSHYPSHFIKGIAVGDALPCRGTWQFYCSGTWYGSYEVRRCYDTSELTGVWEDRGESFSRLGSSSNELIDGDEEEEECWVRLFITRTKYLGYDELAGGWPADSCSNRLIVYSYNHHMLLQAALQDDDEETAYYIDISAVPIEITGSIITYDWSWQAFSLRYGYPQVLFLHESRLIFAGTSSQPQTLWFSVTDDLNNFLTGDLDSSSMLLEMSTSTQAAICWATSRGDCIMLGTEEAEWCIQASDSSSAITPSNVRLRNYGYNGSAHVPAVCLNDDVIYCERGGGRVYQYGYNYDAAAYVSTDLTVFAPHIGSQGGGIISGTDVRKPDHKAVFVMADGTLALMTYNKYHDVNAWHRYNTEGTITSACALPDGERSDRLFLMVTRSGSRFIEVMDDDSEYYDNDGLDYTSEMVTTAFAAPDYNAKKTLAAAVEIYVGGETEASGITVSMDGEVFVPLDREGTLKKGWVSLVGASGWTQHPIVGIRCTGRQGLQVLSMQG